MTLDQLRRIFARQMLAQVNALDNKRLEDAFASVPREAFLGEGSWRIFTPWSPNILIPAHDPALIYQDVVVALDAERGVNNGSPSLHACWMNLVAPQEGERITHVGAGAGYYSAILAELVTAEGRVTAIEYDARLAESAAENLEDRRNVSVITDDGRNWPRESTDVVYVNFASPRPARAWIDNLRVGGRLIFPLGVPREMRGLNAVTVLVTRTEEGFAARCLAPVSFVFADGGPAPGEDISSLRSGLERGGWQKVRSLVWDEPVDQQKCWCSGSNWALSFEEPATA